MTKVIIAFRDFAKARKNWEKGEATYILSVIASRSSVFSVWFSLIT
jgi:hypothetical protein